jgi:hypothetical protein
MRRYNPQFGLIRHYRNRPFRDILSISSFSHQQKQELRREVSMRNAILAVSFLLTLASGTAAASQPELLVQQFRFDKVGNPNQIERVLTAVDSKGFRAALPAVGKMFGADAAALQKVSGIANVTTKPTQDDGGEHYGNWQSPAGYTICKADIANPSFNNMSTFNVSLRHPHPNRISIDGAYYHFMSGKTAGAAPGDSWIDGTVTLAYVLPQLRDKYHCATYGTCAWLLKDGQFRRDVGPCVNPIGDVRVLRAH